MDNKQILAIIQRIVLNSPYPAIKDRLDTLYEILRIQDISPETLDIIKNASKDAGFIQDIAKTKVLNEEDMRIAHDRAEQNRRHMEEMERYGRC